MSPEEKDVMAEDDGEEKEPKAKADGEEEETEKGCKKSDSDNEITQDDLEKSLERLAAITETGDVKTRKQALLEKAMTDDGLEKSEQDELYQLMGGVVPAEDDTLAEEIEKSMDGNEPLQKALDVSPYLQEQHEEMKKSLGVVSEHIEKADSRQHGFNLILAKAMVNIGNLTKAISERLGTIEEQPARAPKSRGVGGLEKSFGGAPPVSDNLSKAQVLSIISTMVEESVEKGLGGATEDGINLVTESTKYEQFNQIDPRLAAKVKERAKAMAAN